MRLWCRVLLKLAGLRVEVKGLENLPRKGVGAIYVFNHFSLYDIPVLHAMVPRSFRFGAKSELFKIPFFGWAMRSAHALEIHRTNLSSVIRVYDAAKARVANGEGFVLAPEGTRQRSPHVGAFKTGPFILAINAQAPIVPIVLVNVEKVIPKGKLMINWNWERKILLEILPIVETRELKLEDRDRLKNQVHDSMVSAFSRLQRSSFFPDHGS